MPEPPIVKKIKAYAFNHGCDLDSATFKVPADMSNSFQPSHLPGMFDRLFVEEDHNEKSRPAD